MRATSSTHSTSPSRTAAKTGKLGGSANTGGTGTGFSFSYTGHILSSIHINGVSNYYGSADCAVFGFKYAEPDTTSEIIEAPTGWTTTA